MTRRDEQAEPEPAGDDLIAKPGTDWPTLYRRCQAVAPEAFGPDGLRNRWAGRWRDGGVADPAFSPVDGTPIAGPPRVDEDTAWAAVRAAHVHQQNWRGAFVGGALLVHSVTQGPPGERPFGNYRTHSRYPAV